VVPPTPRSPTKGLGARSVVDDVSERGDDNDSIYGDGGSELSSVVYDKAVTTSIGMSWFPSHRSRGEALV
jgi:hypothetical protein